MQSENVYLSLNVNLLELATGEINSEDAMPMSSKKKSFGTL